MDVRALDLAWAAELIEGEGSIAITKLVRGRPGTLRGYALAVGVTMTDRQCIELLKTILGGHTSNHHIRTNNPNFRPSYAWGCASAHAGRVLMELLPYFRSDRVRAKADLAIAFQGQKRLGAARWIKGYSELQQEYHEKMRILNLRGAEAIARDKALVAA